ncbi:MAG: PLP-dependent transferase [Synechococcus sp.]|nr:PLP-dependent transferase [Synechococcus sp.]
MSARDLLEEPCWQGSDLGHPLPDSTHAVSVALPRWRDVVAYEENDPSCRDRLRAVYPRFGFHPLVAELARAALAATEMGTDSSAWPYPSETAAQCALAHCRRQTPMGASRIAHVHDMPCLIADGASTPAAKAFWQHAGLGASSRQAAIALGHEPKPEGDGHQARCTIRNRLATIYGCEPTAISLHPSGMAALHSALRLVTASHPNRPTLQVGFPYVDVLKLPQVVFAGAELLTDSSTEAIAASLDRLNPAAVVVELPSNPMLQCVDLITLSELAHARGIPVIADDTVGSGLNIDALPYADLVFSSLTKSFAGRGDVLAGALVVSPHSRWRQDFQAGLSTAPAVLSDADAICLEEASRDVRQRIPQLNAHCSALAERLRHHPAVKRVLHPTQCSTFQALMRPGAGHGCLLSFELKGGLDAAERVYDALAVSKGPSLGTNFTLCCPYVLLAHYDELAWANECGVPAHLLRVSVGLEDPDTLWQRFERALGEACVREV